MYNGAQVVYVSIGVNSRALVILTYAYTVGSWWLIYPHWAHEVSSMPQARLWRNSPIASSCPIGPSIQSCPLYIWKRCLQFLLRPLKQKWIGLTQIWQSGGDRKLRSREWWLVRRIYLKKIYNVNLLARIASNIRILVSCLCMYVCFCIPLSPVTLELGSLFSLKLEWMSCYYRSPSVCTF